MHEMNYLAHLHLGGQSPDELLGSLYGDFVKGPLVGRFSSKTEAAIQLHRTIDAFTDSHELVKRALSRFPDEKRRYAGIALDMFFDHCLARDWEEYSGVPLKRFAQAIYGILESEPSLPPSLAKVVPLMISEDWLCAYKDIEMIGYGLGIISKRLSRPEGLDGLFEHLKDNYELLSTDFREFYPALRAFARSSAVAQA
jgi:acyl carrier protein phosphodiesterase